MVYIDYEGGSDANNGTSTTSAFKHHPWDANATGNALATTGIKTYVFKRGVIYRGFLIAKESGSAGNPIRLTSDPSWGTGDACLFGSERVTTTWIKCTAADAPNIPNPANVWYTDLSFTITDNPYGSYATWPRGVHVQTVCEMRNGILNRIEVARAPNWTVTDSNDYLMNCWNVGSSGPAVQGAFTTSASADWIGGSVWCTWGSGSGAGANMATLQQGTITGYSSGALTIDVTTNPGCKFWVENLPQLLDTVNEFWYSPGGAHPRRLYVRLSGDRDPNNAVIEVGARPKIISLIDKHDIVISGLTFGVNNQPRPGTAPEPPHWNIDDGACQAIEFGGTIANIEIANCTFRHTSSAMAPRRDNSVNPTHFDNIRIADNDIAFNDDQAITLGSIGQVKNAAILRNKIYHTGFRQTTRNYSAIPAISVVTATSVEIAGNIIDFCGGSGINNTAGPASGTAAGSQIKVLVHHNKVTRSLQVLNDYGGIESWGQGPSFTFNNISGNARGYRHFSGENEYNPWGHAFYFDHANNQKAFNNIAWGVHNSTTNSRQRNNSGFMQVAGNMIFFANNTMYNLYRAFCGTQTYSTYIGNLFENISYTYHEENAGLSYVSYAKNVYHGSPVNFSTGRSTFAAFQTFLSSGNAETSQLGLNATGAVMINPAGGDFRPTGQAIGNGARIFMPWNLANVVGLWHFWSHPADYTTIRSENNPLGGAGNTLRCAGATASTYVMGALEDWTNGALRFNGASTYCNASTSTPFDVTTGSLILEVYLKTSAGGVVISKASGSGYILDIPASGQARMRLLSGGEYSVSSAANVKDGNWHHILAEVDRGAGKVNIWVDGTLSNGTTSGSMPAAGASLGNSGELLIGKDAGGNFFTGDIDFARVAKSSFAESATSFDELYAWEFDGPAQRDFAGAKIVGARDAGAIQYTAIGTSQPAHLAAGFTGVSVRRAGTAGRYVIGLGSGFADGQPVSMRVLNAAGRTVWTTRITPDGPDRGRTVTVRTGDWARGCYILRVASPAAAQVFNMPLYR